MAIIFDLDLEGSTPWGFNGGIQTNGGDWSIGAAGALGGSSQGNINVVNDTNQQYGVAALGSNNTSGAFQMRCYVDPNGVTGGTEIQVCNVTTQAGTSNGSIGLYRTGGGVLQALFTIGITPTGSEHRYVDITDEPHYLEIRVVRASGPSTGDGYMQCWIDGVEQTAITDIDNYTRFANTRYVSVGATIKTGSWSGTFYVDEIVVRDDETYIGPVAGGGTEYQQSVSGSVTPSGAQLKLLQRALVGALSLAGVVVRLISVLKSGSLSPGGTLVRKGARALAGALAPAGAQLKLLQRTITGAISSAGGLVRKIFKYPVGGVTPTGQQLKLLQRALSGAVSMAGFVVDSAAEVFQVALGGSLAMAGGLGRTFKKLLEGVVAAIAGLLESYFAEWSPNVEGIIYGPSAEGSCYRGETYTEISGPDDSSVIRGVEG